MPPGYRLSRTAEDDLEEILAYILGQSGSDRAVHVHGRFVQAFEHLAEMPGSGWKRGEITGERVRWWRVFNWIVLYEWKSSPITILRIVHSAQALERILNPDSFGR